MINIGETPDSRGPDLRSPGYRSDVRWAARGITTNQGTATTHERHSGRREALLKGL